MQYGYSNNSNLASPIVVFFAGLIVAAFVLGGIAFSALQWLQPQIGAEITAQKREEARTLQLQNDDAAENLRHKQVKDTQDEQGGEIGLEQQRAFGALVLQTLSLWATRIADSIPWALGTLVAAWALRWLALSLLQQRIKMSNRHLAQPDLLPDAPSREQSGDPASITARIQSESDKELYRAEREWARQREKDERAFTTRRAA